MYWILAAVLLVIALAAPRLRAVSIVGLLVLAALLAWGVAQRVRVDAEPEIAERGRPSSPATALQAAPLDEIGMETIRLSGGGAPFELTGRIVNRSRDLQLKSVTIRITRRDCYAGALDPTGCAVLWQDRHWMPLLVPPQQTRAFSSSIWMRGAAPRPRGEIQDSFELIAATAETASSEEAER